MLMLRSPFSPTNERDGHRENRWCYQYSACLYCAWGVALEFPHMALGGDGSRPRAAAALRCDEKFDEEWGGDKERV